MNLTPVCFHFKRSLFPTCVIENTRYKFYMG
jgi:hypothetical protein